MIMATILYTREYPINLPGEIMSRHDVFTANTASDAIWTIDRENKGGSIDAFVIGGVMLRDGITVKEADKVSSERSASMNRLYKLRHDDEELTPEIVEARARKDLIDEDLYERCLDLSAGTRVFEHVVRTGILGVKPILILTSMPLCDFGLNILHNKHDIRKGVTYAAETNAKGVFHLDIPADEIVIKEWFYQNVKR